MRPGTHPPPDGCEEERWSADAAHRNRRASLAPDRQCLGYVSCTRRGMSASYSSSSSSFRRGLEGDDNLSGASQRPIAAHVRGNDSPPAGPGAPGGAERGEGGHLNDAELERLLNAESTQCGRGTNWKNSVAALLDLLGAPSDHDARQRLARRLGYDRDFADAAGMNLWLHALLLKRIAAGGGTLDREAILR